MSVDTYMKGKNTKKYRRIEHDGVMILVAPKLTQLASKVELVTQRKVTGKKLVAVAHHKHTAACRHD